MEFGIVKELPEWALQMVPVDMDGAAKLLGISRRFLIDTLKDNPRFERRGAKKVFYPEHIMQLREAMSEPSASRQKQEGGHLLPLPLTEDKAFDDAMRMVTNSRARQLK